MGSTTANANKTMKQYVATKKGGPFQLINGAYPTPGPNEICIRNRTIALNQLDWKNLHHGQMVQSWPEVFGIDTAGVVEVVGDKVAAFKAGDAVMSSAGLGGRRGAFQDITTVPAHFASRKPASWTFAQACSAPICYLAAAAAITRGLSTPLPHLTPPATPKDESERVSASGSEYQHHLRKKSLPSSHQLNLAAIAPPPPPLSSVLVLGGSSGVGASAIQLLRLALGEDAVILSTNSAVHNKRLVALGATACLDRGLPPTELASAIRGATRRGEGVDAILDAVAAIAEEGMGEIFGVLRREGQRLYTHVFTGREVRGVPEGVRCTRVFAHMMFQESEAGVGLVGQKGVGEGMDAMAKLADLVEEGKFKLPLEVEVVGKGLEDVSRGLEKLRKGVSGMKLVVAL